MPSIHATRPNGARPFARLPIHTLRPALLTLLLAACGGGGGGGSGDTNDAGGQVAGLAAGATPTVLATMDGSGLGRGLMDRCTPSIKKDFADADGRDWVYRRLTPQDCAASPNNPLVFNWTQPERMNTAVPWAFSLRDADTKKQVSVSAMPTASPRLHLLAPLKAGRYEWQVAYVRQDTGKVEYSEWRRFQVAATDKDTHTTYPSGNWMSKTVAPKAHPRLLPAGKTFPGLAAGAQADPEFKLFYAAFTALADRARDTALPVPLGNPNDVRMERKFIEYLAYTRQFTGDASYGAAAIARMEEIAKWDLSAKPGKGTLDDDQLNREYFMALATGLDVLNNELTPTQRKQFRNALHTRMEKAFSVFSQFDGFPYRSHDYSSVRFMLQALLRVVDAEWNAQFTDTATQSWFATTWDTYLTLLPLWGENDGSDGNGTAYSVYNMAGVPTTAADILLVTDYDLTRLAWLKNASNYFTAFLVPDSLDAIDPARPLGAFGDEMETPSYVGPFSADHMRLLATLTKSPTLNWYWRARQQNLSPARNGNGTYNALEALDPVHFILRGVRSAGAAQAAPTKNNWAFEDTGLVALHSDIASPTRSSLFFRSSRFAAYNHSHADQNSIVFNSNGKSLLVNAGYYPPGSSGSAHNNLTRATRYQNAITVDADEVGQAESDELKPKTTPDGKPDTYIGARQPAALTMEPRGALVNFYEDGQVAVATGDATLAYRGLKNKVWQPVLSSAHRTVAYLRDKKIAIWYDAADSGTAHQWNWHYHTTGDFLATDDFKAQSAGVLKVVAKAGGASGCMSMHGPAVALSPVTSGFEVMPDQARPEQRHVRWSTTSASKSMASVTILREDCAPMPKDFQFTPVGTGSKQMKLVVGGHEFVFDGKAVKVSRTGGVN